MLDLIVKLKKEKQTSMILITHDLGIVAEVCDKGCHYVCRRNVEFGSLEQIYRQYLSSIHKRDCLVRFRIWIPMRSG